jgi:hypothetical protein
MYQKSKEEYSGDVEDDLTKFITTAGIIIILAICILNIIL